MNTRQAFIDETQDAFTYKSGPLTDEQHDLFQKINDRFEIAQNRLETEVESVLLPVLHHTGLAGYIQFLQSKSVASHIEKWRSVLRKAHRRANAAIANDFKDAPAPVETKLHPREQVEGIQQAHCHLITQIFYDLAVDIACLIPLGRHAALCRTELEDARGEYMDAVNNFYNCQMAKVRAEIIQPPGDEK